MIRAVSASHSDIYEAVLELARSIAGHTDLESLLSGVAQSLRRVVDFGKWCERQPRGESARDDILTIWVVGFLEELFDSDVTRPLIPHLVPKETLITNAEYLKTWVGPDDYQSALGEY
mgnify:CR=1 FL=1